MIDPPILILDDALSAVDTDTEAAILRGLAGVMRTRTAILIAHRASTIRHADHIVVLDGGPIVEQGSHDALVQAAGPCRDVPAAAPGRGAGRLSSDPAASDDDIIGSAYDARLMRRLLGYLRPHWRSVLLGLVVIVATSLLQLAAMADQGRRRAHRARRSGRRRPGRGAVPGRARRRLRARVRADLDLADDRPGHHVRDADGHLRPPAARRRGLLYDRHAVGRLMTRVTSDVDALNDLFSAGVVAVFGDAFMLAGIVGVVLWMDWRLLVTFSVLPLIVIVTQWFRRHVRESYRRVRGCGAHQRLPAGEPDRHGDGAAVPPRDAELRALRGDQSRPPRRQRRGDLLLRGVLPGDRSGGGLAAALIIVAGGHWVGTGTLTIGALVAFLQHAQRFFRPISDMSEKFNLLQAAMASSERIFTLLDTPVTIASPAAATPRASGSRGHIVFDHVVRLRRRRRDGGGRHGRRQARWL